MNKVYLVGSYGDVEGIFSTKEDAELFVSESIKHDGPNCHPPYIKEYMLDEKKGYRSKRCWVSRIDKESGSIIELDKNEHYDLFPENVDFIVYGEEDNKYGLDTEISSCISQDHANRIAKSKLYMESLDLEDEKSVE